LLGAEPTFQPHDVEAVWQLAEDRYPYVVEDGGRAGSAISFIWVDDPVSEVARIAGRGVEPVEVEKHGRAQLTPLEGTLADRHADGFPVAVMSPGVGTGLTTMTMKTRVVNSQVPVAIRLATPDAQSAHDTVREAGATCRRIFGGS
jgi:hypothetical protein